MPDQTVNGSSIRQLLQGGIVALGIGALFWLGYTYAAVIEHEQQLHIVGERQINVRERLRVLEYKLEDIIKNQENQRRSYPYVDQSGEPGGRGK